MQVEFERLRILFTVFADAARISDATRRDAFVEQACHGDSGLRADVFRLLQIHDLEPSGQMEDRIRSAIERAARDLPPPPRQ